MVKLSVLMPNYNGEEFLEEAINSILKQTYKDFEFIIVDDCSSDDSWKIIQEYARKDKRIKAFRNKRNSGVTKTLNKALAKSKGELIARMDADDIASDKRFEKQVKKIREGYDVVGSNISLIDEKGKRVGKREYSQDVNKRILFESPLAHPSVMLRRELFDKYGFYDEQFSTGQDYDRWLCFWSKGAEFFVVQDHLLKYRIHKRSVKESKTKESLRNTLLIKKNAKKYGVSFGFAGSVRMFIERTLLLLPSSVILKIFYLVKKSD